MQITGLIAFKKKHNYFIRGLTRTRSNAVQIYKSTFSETLHVLSVPLASLQRTPNKVVELKQQKERIQTDLEKLVGMCKPNRIQYCSWGGRCVCRLEEELTENRPAEHDMGVLHKGLAMS